MKIGILSDSHDALLKIRKAVQIFTEKKLMESSMEVIL